MAQLAIKGHQTRGSEVIALLEMLGGENKYQVTAIRETYGHFVDGGTISFLQINQLIPGQFIVFTIEEFIEKFPYKIGDKVYATYNNKLYEGEIKAMRWCREVKCVLYQVDSIHNLRVENILPRYNVFTKEIMEEDFVPYELAKKTQRERF